MVKVFTMTTCNCLGCTIKLARENGSGHSQPEKIFTVLFEMDLNWGRGARSDKCETSAVKPAMSEDSGAVQQSVKS